MGARIWFIFWALIALFIVVPILNSVVLLWTEEGGVLDQTFNASNPEAWNTTGNILSANETAGIGLTPFESAMTQFYVPIIVVFLVVIILYVLGKGWGGRKE